jgi:hypothetical protein
MYALKNASGFKKGQNRKDPSASPKGLLKYGIIFWNNPPNKQPTTQA